MLSLSPLCSSRPGVTPGGVGKADGATQQVSLGMRSSLSKVDQDNHPHLPDRRDRLLGSDKERVNLRTVNKYGDPFLHFLFHSFLLNLYSGLCNFFCELML